MPDATAVIEGAVAGAATQVETPVENKTEGVLAAVESKADKIVAAVRIELTDAEKLVIRNVENEYLKAQMELQRLSSVTQNASRQFTNTVESYVKKYAIDPAVHVFDTVELVFKKKN
jgi:hypothetical protein